MSVIADPREAILNRVLAIAKSIVGETHAFRNSIDVPEELKPAIAILDADEEVQDSAFGRKRPANAPLIVGLLPEIWLITSAKSKNVGGEIHSLKKRILKGILTDSTLLALCHDGEVRYEGILTGLANGRGMVGQAQMLIRFMYVLHPAAL